MKEKIKGKIKQVCLHLLNHKIRYLVIVGALVLFLTSAIIITTVIHNKQEKELAKLFVNKTFVTEISDSDNYKFFSIAKFNDKGQYLCEWVQLTLDGKEITEAPDLNNFPDIYSEGDSEFSNSDSDMYKVEISLFGKKYLIFSGSHEICMDNDVISFGDYHLIEPELEKMLDNYYKKIEDAKNEENKKETEEKEIKSHMPDKDEFYERVLQIFPQVNDWQLYGNSKSLYMDPYNSNNFCVLSESPVLTFNDGYNKVTFMGSENRITLSESKGVLSEERYNQIIKLALGDLKDEQKIPDLATFKKLTDTENKAYPTSHSAEFKGMTYHWEVSYSNGEYNGYYFFIDKR